MTVRMTASASEGSHLTAAAPRQVLPLKRRASCAMGSARLRPALLHPPRGAASPPASTGTNAPFDRLCGTTSYVGGYGARSVGSPKRGRTSRTGITAAMPKRPPRHLEPPPRPWRLALFAFGLTASVLAALVASAALVPHDPAPPTPSRPPGGTPVGVLAGAHPASSPTATTRQPSTTRAPSPTTPATAPLAQPAPSGTPPAVGRMTTTRALTTFGATTTQPMVTAPTTTVAPTTTQPTTTTTEPTTTEPTTTEPTTTTTEPTTTTTEPPITTGQPILLGDQAATVSAATAAVLLPILGLVYLLRGLVPQPGGKHASRRRRAKHLRRHG
jgi:hypothetical protein